MTPRLHGATRLRKTNSPAHITVTSMLVAAMTWCCEPLKKTRDSALDAGEVQSETGVDAAFYSEESNALETSQTNMGSGHAGTSQAASAATSFGSSAPSTSTRVPERDAGTSYTPLDAAVDSGTDGSTDCSGACGTPPDAYCDENGAAVTYISDGHCSESDCNYEATTTSCEHGCENGACLPDPCADVDCRMPPPNVCENEGLRAYDRQGTCEAGECRYPSELIDCACSDGTCEDPCANRTCDTPPAATCIGNTYRTFGAVGECADGSCNYEYADETCYACGASGCYCPVGTAVIGDSCAECESGTFSSEIDAPSCASHRVCDPGYHVLRPGSRTSDQECGQCPNGMYSAAVNSVSCTAHTACVAPYVEASAPTSTRDRECTCPQTCGDGRCLAANQCCEPTPWGELVELSGVDVTHVETFCVDTTVRIELNGGSGGPPGGAPDPAAWARLVNAAGTEVAYYVGNTGPMYVELEPGSYELTLTITDGEGSGGFSIDIQDPNSPME